MSSLIKSIRFVSLSFGLILSLNIATQALAASVGVNFKNDTQTGDPGLNPGDSAGYSSYAQINWNNVAFNQNYTSVSGTDLNNQAGVATTLDVLLTANPGDNWAMHGLPLTTGDNKLMFSGVSEYRGDLTHTYNVTQIPYASYELVLYHSHGDYSPLTSTIDFVVTATTGSTSFQKIIAYPGGQNGFDGTLDLGPDVTIVSGRSGNLTFTASWPTSGDHGAGLTGFQIVEAVAETVPEPSTYALGLLGLLGLGCVVLRKKYRRA